MYNGDTDPCVSYEGTRLAIEKVGFREVAPYRHLPSSPFISLHLPMCMQVGFALSFIGLSSWADTPNQIDALDAPASIGPLDPTLDPTLDLPNMGALDGRMLHAHSGKTDDLPPWEHAVITLY